MIDTTDITARLALSDAILEAIKESGLLRGKRHGARSAQSPAAKKIAAARMRAYRAKKAKQAAKLSKAASTLVKAKAKPRGKMLAEAPETAATA